MIRKYIIDGNNLIGKIAELKKLQKSNPQASREKLVFLLRRYFDKHKFEVSLYFDGFPKEIIAGGKIRIKYSYEDAADFFIKREIDASENPRTLAVVSSDSEIFDYAKINACKAMKAEEFLRQIEPKEIEDEKERAKKELSDDEILRMFEEREGEE